jgi:hypothetical protein
VPVTIASRHTANKGAEGCWPAEGILSRDDEQGAHRHVGHRRGVLKDTEFRAEYETLEQSLPWPPPRSMREAPGDAGAGGQGHGHDPGGHRAPGRRPRPSTRTLERFAKATGTRLRIRFVPDRATV